MLGAAVKSPVFVRIHIIRSSVSAAEQTAHSMSGPRRRPSRSDRSPSVRPLAAHAGPVLRHESRTQRSPSIRARAPWRGSQRLCSLTPDTGAAVPPLWRSRWRDPAQTVPAARVRRTAVVLGRFQDRAGRHDTPRHIPPQGDHQLARHRHNANPPRAFALPKVRLIPLRQRAVAVATAPSSTPVGC